LPTVQADERAIGWPNQHEPAAADSRVVAVHLPERQRRGHRRVDRVASPLESSNSRIGRQRMDCRHDAALAAGVQERNAQQPSGQQHARLEGKPAFHSMKPSRVARRPGVGTKKIPAGPTRGDLKAKNKPIASPEKLLLFHPVWRLFWPPSVFRSRPTFRRTLSRRWRWFLSFPRRQSCL